jgi:hypothetical protein
VSEKQVGYIYKLLADKKQITDRKEAHLWVTDQIGRQITSLKELTKREASKVIDTLLGKK